MKHVYKLVPVSLYDIRGLEGWLEERADEGLFPVRINGDFTQFRRDGTAPGARFRLEPSNGQIYPGLERLELYQAAGWGYEGTVGKTYFLFYTADPAAPELHTDPVTRGLSLEHLARQVKRARRRMQIWRLAILILFLSSIALLWTRYPRRLPLLLVDLSGGVLMFLVWSLWLWRREERDTRLLLDLQRSLELGISPLPPPRGKSRLLFRLFTVVALLVLLGGQFYQRPIPLERFSGPYLDLQQLESEPLLTYEELFGEPYHKSPGSDWGENTVTRRSSLLSPSYYTVDQTLLSQRAGARPYAFSSTGEPGSCYSPALKAVYLHLTVPALGRVIAEAQLAHLELVNLSWTYEELSYPGLDFVILARAAHFPEWQLAAAGRGGHVIALRYCGREDLADHLDALAGALM